MALLADEVQFSIVPIAVGMPRRNLVGQGMDPAGGAPEQFAALIKTDIEKWGDIGNRLGVKLD